MKKLLLLLFALVLSCTSLLNAQWERTEGIYGGTVNALAVSGNTIFAGTEYDGVHVSTDNGVSWNRTSLDTHCVRALAVNGNYLFAGCNNPWTGVLPAIYVYSKGLYVSSNNGQNWSQTTLNDHYITSIYTYGNNVYAGTFNDSGYFVWLSTNNGTNWNKISKNFSGNITSFTANGNNIFAGTSSYYYNTRSDVWLTTNNGANWTPTNLDTIVSSLITFGNNIFAGTNDGIYVTSNNGLNWIQSSLNDKPISSFVINGNNIFAGTHGFGIFRSTDNGITWIQTEFNSKSVSSLAVNGSMLFAGIRANGANWDKLNKMNSNGYDIFTNKFGENQTSGLRQITGNGGVFVSSDNGFSWSTSFYNSTVRAFAKSGTNLVAGTWSNGGVYFSSNEGQNWLQSDLNNISILCLINKDADLFAGTYNGIYKSTNNGINWIKIDHIRIGSIHALKVQGSKIVAGTTAYQSYPWPSPDNGGVYISEDNCQTWSRTNLNSHYIYSLAVSGNYIFAGTLGSTSYDSNGVFLSTNSGQNWILTGLRNKTIVSLIIKDNYVFAGTYNNGIYRTIDNGQTWTHVGLANQFVESIIVEGNNLLAGGYGVYLSTDNGNTWLQKNTGFQTIPTVGALMVADNYLFAGTYYNSAWRRPYSEIVINIPEVPTLISPINNSTGVSVTPVFSWNSVYGATGYRIMIASDENFTNILQNVTAASNQYSVPAGILQNNTKYYWKVAAYNGNGQSLFSLVWNFTTKPPTQQGPWTLYNTGVSYSLFGVDFASYNSELGVAIGEGGTVIRTTNGGEEWMQTYSNINIWLNDVKFDPNTQGTVWAAGMGGVIIKSTNDGLTWNVVRAYDTPMNTFRGIGIPIGVPGYAAFVGYAGTFFETTNNGLTFVKRNDIQFTMHSIAFSPDFINDGKAIICGTDGLLWNTTNSGANWISRNTNRYDYLNDIIYVEPNVALLCGNNGTILRTTNNGNTWSANMQFLTTQHLRSIDAFNSKVTVCGDNGQIMTSNDGGVSFIDQLNGEIRHLYGVSLRSLTEGTVVGEAGTAGTGAMYFTTMNGAVSVNENEELIPKQYELKQNYPNPFNPITKIKFGLPKTSKVNLVIFDVLGREVAKLIANQIKPAGLYTVEFSGVQFSSGVYFYRLEAGEFIETKRMVLIK